MSEIAQKLQQVVFRRASRTVSNQYSRNIFKKLSDCHTGNMGVHHYRCESSVCGHEKYQFHSCGNRHCPNCGGSKRDQWIADKEAELLPTAYYHIVFTLPHELNGLSR
jgi:Transposase zinc-binding domain